jgi:hypothetical protein
MDTILILNSLYRFRDIDPNRAFRAGGRWSGS